MKRFGFFAIAIGLALPTLVVPAHAQITYSRTWVSGAGDDTSSCTRPTPCATFAGAMAKTSAGGEINCLDGANFGGLTITKSLTVSCEGVTAGTSAAFVINAGVNDVIHLSGLDFSANGQNFTAGIRFNSGGALIVQDCKIRNYVLDGSLGIQFQPSTAATLTVENTSIANIGSATSGGGILITASGSGSATAIVKNVTIAGNLVGMGVISNGQTVIAQIINSAISNNRATGIVVSGAGVTATISRSAITNNKGASSSGPLLSLLDNHIIGNASNTPLTSVGGYQ